MIDVKEFLIKNAVGFGSYALVSYNNKIKPTWFTKHRFENEEWFLESPCQLRKIMEVQGNIDTFCREYMNECICLAEGESEEEYISEFVKPMVIDGWLYEIENFQCSPYLPKEVDEIKLISERECLEFMLKQVDKFA